MVLPDGTPDRDPPRSRGKSLALGVGAAALALGALALGILTAPPPDEAAVETTVTTSRVDQPIDPENFTVDDIARGVPLEWEQVAAANTTFPLALLEHDGWLYLFASNPRTFRFEESGLIVWRSENGSEWERLGQVIDQGQRISAIASTPHGLVTAGATEDGIAVWRSDDAIEWTRETIDVQGLSENASITPSVVGGDEQTLVIAGQVSIDVQRLLQTTLTGSFGHDVSPASYTWWPEFDGDDMTFVVQGPLGFPLTEVRASGLGLSQEEQETIRRQFNIEDTMIDVWVSTEGVDGWARGAIEDGRMLTEIAESPTGGLIATGFSASGSRTWTSVNGVSWETTSLGLVPNDVQEWNSIMVGPLDASPLIVTSDDGVDWEPIGVDEHFPGPMQWNTTEMASGPRGLAAVVEAFIARTDPFQDAEPIVLEDRAGTLTIDYSTGTYSLQSGDTSYTWSMGVDTRPDGILVDPTGEVIRFLDTDTLEILATFTFDELFEAEADYWSNNYGSQQELAFVFSPNGEDWTIQDAATYLGDGRRVSGLAVTDTHIVAATSALFGRISPISSPGFEIWSAPIP